ncbi:CemA family protein [Anabaena sp. FACHB-1237]|uniref:CemA family protein n=1 Tax=Anabaena sp. FACHB-1237 TaxID=2692769 RepID=UPI00167FF3E6|nr:CemA family protein [Anabaena sp. FACHB-1237]MBD2137063.1 CemA family protein [Anabaena sp. FACHB-1237]
MKKPFSSVHNQGYSQPFKFIKTGIFPRSIGRTLKQIANDFSAEADIEFLNKYRISRQRTIIATRFFIMLVLVPLLTQKLSKQVLFIPIIEKVNHEHITQIFLNSDMEEKALHELKIFTSELKFQQLLHPQEHLTPDKKQEKIKEKAQEIAAKFREESINAISNIFADLLSLITFTLVIILNKKDIIYVQYVLDKIVYGLSDSAKAFLIILLTDIFVGFHSPHGWEVILEGIAEHLGITANTNYIFLFIATFPVILDTIFKYWIFRYLSRLSPSALATLKEMDD